MSMHFPIFLRFMKCKQTALNWSYKLKRSVINVCSAGASEGKIRQVLDRRLIIFKSLERPWLDLKDNLSTDAVRLLISVWRATCPDRAAWCSIYWRGDRALHHVHTWELHSFCRLRISLTLICPPFGSCPISVSILTYEKYLLPFNTQLSLGLFLILQKKPNLGQTFYSVLPLPKNDPSITNPLDFIY